MGAKSRFPHGRQDDEALKPHVQYAALPYRVGGGLEILLITSRESGRWVIPKGWPIKGKTAWAAAGREEPRRLPKEIRRLVKLASLLQCSVAFHLTQEHDRW